jgi:hypothetical protein
MLEVPGFVSITYLTTGKHAILLPPRLGAIMSVSISGGKSTRGPDVEAFQRADDELIHDLPVHVGDRSQPRLGVADLFDRRWRKRSSSAAC